MSTTRTLGTIPISVGTALALEKLPSTKMYLYHTFLINLRTIVRNARDAFDSENPVTSKELYEAAKSDILQLAQYIVDLKLQTPLELKIYHPTYHGLPRLFPYAKLKDISKGSDKQKNIFKLDTEVCKKLITEFGKSILQRDCKIPDFIGTGLIMTHHPVDLVTTDAYTRLQLLESYTGAIKTHGLFYSKLTGSDKLTNIPLNKLTIQIFGDNSTDFYGHSLSVKNEIKQLATIARWSTASTPSFVNRSIRSLDRSPEKDILLKLI